MISMRVVGVDPGKTTGLSLIVDGEVRQELEAKSLLSLWGALYATRPDTLVVESTINSPTLDAASPYEATGVCKLYAQSKGVGMFLSNSALLQGSKRPPEVKSPHIWSARVHALAYSKLSEE